MGANTYHFVDRWRVRGSIEEVWNIVFDAESLARWWPSTYRAVWEIAAGEASGLGSAFGLRARGWLPYAIRFDFETPMCVNRTASFCKPKETSPVVASGRSLNPGNSWT